MIGRRAGQSFEQYCQFIAWVKAGKKALILGPEYVVMSWKLYEELQKKDKKEPVVYIDEEANWA